MYFCEHLYDSKYNYYNNAYITLRKNIKHTTTIKAL